MLRFRSLGSGSTGNATLIEARSGATTTRLLVDCGFGIRQIESRLLQAGVEPASLDAIFITHEHSDHVGSAFSLARRHRIAVWTSRGTHAAIGEPEHDGLLCIASDSVTIDLGALQIAPFTVPHDAREPLQLTCTDGAARLGVLTDLGHASAQVERALQGCSALVLECNHDPDLLAVSSYPPFLKQRVGGRHGHLANHAAAQLLERLQLRQLGALVAAHLSEQNNRPELARAALRAVTGRDDADIHVASAASGTDWLAA